MECLIICHAEPRKSENNWMLCVHQLAWQVLWVVQISTFLSLLIVKNKLHYDLVCACIEFCVQINGSLGGIQYID